jgi:hypothetical protein
MINNDNPKDAAPPTQEERATILDTLSQYVTTDRVLTLDGEQRRGRKSTATQLELPFGELKKI